jgi:hypothetical protein
MTKLMKMNFMFITSIAILYEIETPFMYLNELILTKKSVNKLKNQIDLIEFKRIKKISEDQCSKQ